MDSNIKEDWIAALTSDEYKQGRKVLRTPDDEYCCLGVLCDLAVKAGVAKWVRTGLGWEVDKVNAAPHDTWDRGTTLLPVFIASWAGLDGDNPVARLIINGEENARSLAELNDHYRYSLAEIARVIEEVL